MNLKLKQFKQKLEKAVERTSIRIIQELTGIEYSTIHQMLHSNGERYTSLNKMIEQKLDELNPLPTMEDILAYIDIVGIDNLMNYYEENYSKFRKLKQITANKLYQKKISTEIYILVHCHMLIKNALPSIDTVQRESVINLNKETDSLDFSIAALYENNVLLHMQISARNKEEALGAMLITGKEHGSLIKFSILEIIAI